MANWSAVRDALRDVEHQIKFTWAELDELVGGLPPSAYKHPAFWKGARSGWPGFTTATVDVGHSVTFVRRGPSGGRGVPTPNPTPQDASAPVQSSSADVILVSCVKEKRPDPAPAKDLYTSPLFARERRHAEASGKPWFILSAKHGLVDPDQVLEPYDLRLSDTPPSYQSVWGHRVVQQLAHAAGPLRGKTIEVHAGVAYTNPIRGLLRDAGADLIEPLEGLTIRRLAREVPTQGRLAEDPVTCPTCGSSEWLPIVYGLPDHELFLAAQQQKVELGGCCISDDSPTLRCRACSWTW